MNIDEWDRAIRARCVGLAQRAVSALAIAALAGSAARADSGDVFEKRLRLRIDARRTDRSRTERRVKFGPADSSRVDEVAYCFGEPTVLMVAIRFQEAVGGGWSFSLIEARVDAARRPRPPEFLFPLGCRRFEGSISDARYRSFCRGIRLLWGARLTGEVGPESPVPSGVDGALWVKGNRLRIDAPVERADRDQFIETSLTDPKRGRLLRELIAEAIAGWRAEAREGGNLAAWMDEIASTRGFRRDLRILAAGWFGQVAARRDIERTPDGRWRKIALVQLDTGRGMQGDGAHPRLWAAHLSSSEPLLRAWARDRLKEHPNALRDHLLDQMRTGSDDERRDAVFELGKLGHRDAVLPALKDASADVRVEAAGVLEATEPLIGIVKDRSAQAITRCVAIIYLTWPTGSARSPRTGQLLRKIALDESEDVEVRGGAAVGLAHLGQVDATRDLLRLLRTRVPAKPVYLSFPGDLEWYLAFHDVRGAAAEALGLLRSKEAVRHLIRVLEKEPATSRHMRRKTVVALGRIGDVRAIDAIRGALSIQGAGGRSVKYVHKSIKLIAAIGERDLATMLALGHGPPGWLAKLLSDTFTPAELAAALEQHPEHRRVLLQAAGRK